MGRIIAFTGAHGTGKTTAVFEYIAQLKKSGGAYEIGLIEETPRRCPLPIFGKNSVASVEAQNWIFAEQMRCEIDAVLNYEITVADRTVVDVVAYSMLCGLTDLARDQLAMARHHVAIYDTIFIKPIAGCRFLVDDGFRAMDGEARRKVEEILVNVYTELNLPLIPVFSAPERR